MKYIKLFVFILLFINIKHLFAQSKAQQKKMFYESLDLIYAEKYNKALDLLFQLDALKLDQFLNQKEIYGKIIVDSTSIEKVYVKYLIGTCYLEQKDNSGKALQYIEYVVKSGYSRTPDIIYKDLGDLYHLDYQFEKSEYYFNRYLSKAKSNDEYIPYVMRMLKICTNAKVLIKDTIDINIKKLKYPVNTDLDEFKPMATMDDSKLFISRIDVKHEKGKIDTIYSIWMYPKKIGVWLLPKRIVVNTSEPYTLAGISSKGDKIYLSIGSSDQKALYEGVLNDTICSNLTQLDFSNPKYNDTEITFSKDGKTAYFISKRPGGSGGSDIYKTTKKAFGTWSQPENLGQSINSEFDEASPCLKPDGKTFYFSSRGFNTMGGFDLFEANLTTKTIRNLGFPINTPNNNKYISISDSGRIAYFSTNSSNKKVTEDIYEMDIRKDIPYTMIRGSFKITNSEGLNIKAKIKVVNKNQLTMFNTNPDPQLGTYFIFLPPGKEYTLLIDAEGFLPQMINIHVPNQNFFYELKQELVFSHLKLLDKEVGEQIQVRNNFSSTGSKFSYSDIFDEKKKQGYDSLVNLVTQIAINETNKIKIEDPKSDNNSKEYGKLLDLIKESIDQGDTTSLNQLNLNASEIEIYSGTFFYNKTQKNTLLPATQIGATEYIYTAPPINAYNKNKISDLSDDLNKLIKENKTIHNEEINVPAENLDKIDPSRLMKEVNVIQVFFENGQAILPEKFRKQITTLADLLIDNPSLFIELSGYSNAIGDSIPNLRLSEDRAKVVKQLLISNKIPESRIRLFYYGDSKSKNETSENEMIFNRRVDVILYNLENKLR